MSYLEDEQGRMVVDERGDPILDESGWEKIWNTILRIARVKRVRLPNQER